MLWPLRFILLVLLAMAAIFSLSQGQDALYGAIVEGKSRWFVLAAIVAWGRWVEVRLPASGGGAGWLSTLCLGAVGLLLLVYREP